MIIDDLSQMSATLLAISLASERIVTIAKTAFPVWLADEKKTDAQEVDVVADKRRRLLVLAIAFVSAWFTAAMLTNNNNFWQSLFDSLVIGPDTKDPTKGLHLNVLVVGLLCSGGSALWGNLLGYTKAVKEIQTQRKASEGLDYSKKAKDQGLTTFDSGNAVRSPINDLTLDQLTTLTQPDFTITNSRIKRA